MEIYLEGNNGGDILEMEFFDDSTIRLKVVHCCVYTINHIVPVEFLTAVLTKAVVDAGGVIEAMNAVNWPPEYLAELIAKIE